MRIHAKQIKKEICENFDLKSNQVKARWGKGTARYYLDILIDPQIYEEIGQQVEAFAETKHQEWGYTSWDSDFGDGNLAFSVEDFDGRQRFWRRSTTQEVPAPPDHAWKVSQIENLLRAVYPLSDSMGWITDGQIEVNLSYGGDWHTFNFDPTTPHFEILTEIGRTIRSKMYRPKVNWIKQGF